MNWDERINAEKRRAVEVEEERRRKLVDLMIKDTGKPLVTQDWVTKVYKAGPSKKLPRVIAPMPHTTVPVSSTSTGPSITGGPGGYTYGPPVSDDDEVRDPFLPAFQDEIDKVLSELNDMITGTTNPVTIRRLGSIKSVLLTVIDTSVSLAKTETEWRKRVKLLQEVLEEDS